MKIISIQLKKTGIFRQKIKVIKPIFLDFEQRSHYDGYILTKTSDYL